MVPTRFALLLVVAALVLLSCLNNSHHRASVDAAGYAHTTHHNDNRRAGANLNETILTARAVDDPKKFGKLFTRAVQGQVYAQVLYVPNVDIKDKGIHNVIYVATMSNNVYAFDADDPEQADPLWQISLGAPVPVADKVIGTGPLCQQSGFIDFDLEAGVLSTPVIDMSTQLMYIVNTNKDSDNPIVYNHRIRAVDIRSGETKLGPVVITATWPKQDGSQATFDSTHQSQRSSLTLANGVIYFGFGSYCDTPTYYGWIMGYRASDLKQVKLWNSSPNIGRCSIWQSGQGVSVDEQGFLYFVTGDGTFNPDKDSYSNSVIKLDPSGDNLQMKIASYFTPYNVAYLDQFDLDFGACGIQLIPGTRLATAGGKEGKLYLMNMDSLGGFNGVDKVVQSLKVTQFNFHGGPVHWQNEKGDKYIYSWGEGDRIRQFRLAATSVNSGRMTEVAFGDPRLPDVDMPGGILTVSSDGSSSNSGIVWALRAIGNANRGTKPGVLHAYAAADVSIQLWNSQLNASRDSLGPYPKFCPPTVADGKVFAPTLSDIPSRDAWVNVYGLLQPRAANIVGTTSADKSQLTLQLVPSGHGPIQLQWYYKSSGSAGNGAAIANGNSKTVTVKMSDLFAQSKTTAVLIWCTMTNEYGSTNTQEITVHSDGSYVIPSSIPGQGNSNTAAPKLLESLVGRIALSIIIGLICTLLFFSM